MKRAAMLGVVSALALSLSHAPAKAEGTCTDRPDCWPEGSSMHQGLLLVQQQKAADATLHKRHQSLLQVVAASAGEAVNADGRLLTALKAQQAAWLHYRDEECELIGALTGAGGTWPSTYARQCALNHAQLRLRRVQAALRCIQRLPEADRRFGQADCLQQLAPLTNRLTR